MTNTSFAQWKVAHVANWRNQSLSASRTGWTSPRARYNIITRGALEKSAHLLTRISLDISRKKLPTSHGEKYIYLYTFLAGKDT